MPQQIQLRRGTAAAWTSANPVLASGEAGVETDTSKLKFGDGTTAWASLDYVAGGGGTWGSITGTLSAQTDLQTVLDEKVASDPTGVTGADAITNIISLTQAEYDAIGSPSSTTYYIITDAVDSVFNETHAASHTLTASECYGAFYTITSAATLTLPAGANGMSLTVTTRGAVAGSVKAGASDFIYLDGVALDDGDKITNSSTSGDTVVLFANSTGNWTAITDGNWTDGGA